MTHGSGCGRLRGEERPDGGEAKARAPPLTATAGRRREGHVEGEGEAAAETAAPPAAGEAREGLASVDPARSAGQARPAQASFRARGRRRGSGEDRPRTPGQPQQRADGRAIRRGARRAANWKITTTGARRLPWRHAVAAAALHQRSFQSTARRTLMRRAGGLRDGGGEGVGVAQQGRASSRPRPPARSRPWSARRAPAGRSWLARTRCTGRGPRTRSRGLRRRGVEAREGLVEEHSTAGSCTRARARRRAGRCRARRCPAALRDGPSSKRLRRARPSPGDRRLREAPCEAQVRPGAEDRVEQGVVGHEPMRARRARRSRGSPMASGPSRKREAESSRISVTCRRVGAHTASTRPAATSRPGVKGTAREASGEAPRPSRAAPRGAPAGAQKDPTPRPDAAARAVQKVRGQPPSRVPPK